MALGICLFAGVKKHEEREGAVIHVPCLTFRYIRRTHDAAVRYLYVQPALLSNIQELLISGLLQTALKFGLHVVNAEEILTCPQFPLHG